MALAVVITLGLLPTNVFAAHDGDGKPTNLADEVVVALYKGDEFPGEPAVYGTSQYEGFDANFNGDADRFATSATTVLKPEIINKLKLGTPSWGTTVWGYYSITDAQSYFLDNSPLLVPENQDKMIKAVAGNSAGVATHEIIWYVIKYQAHDWFGDKWHIDGIVKERSKYAVNYYGNGNTAGGAPSGLKDAVSGMQYTIEAKPNDMKRVVSGKNAAFLGWNTEPDGSGTAYQPGDKVTITDNLSLYAIWETVTTHTATVNTYLNNIKRDVILIHDNTTQLYLGKDDADLIQLTKTDTGTYTATITENGNYYLYHTEPDGGYHKMGDHVLTIYNADGSLDVHHFSVGYDPNGGAFANGEDPGTVVYYGGTAIHAVSQTPVREGYIFMGWQDREGNVIAPGAQITSAIDKAYTMTALWAEADKVKVNVTINHQEAAGGNNQGEDNHTDTMHKVTFDLLQVIKAVNQPTNLSKYLTETSHAGYAYAYDAVNKVTTYTATDYTFTGLADGIYTVNAIKSGYSTKVITTDANGNLLVDAEGNQIINVVLTYEPDDFDLHFDVVMAPGTPKELYPQAVNVKVLGWGYDANGVLGWHIITQLDGDAAPVFVTVDPATGKGSGFYPVWKHWSDSTHAYEYRLMVTSFVLPDGTIVKADYTSVNRSYISTNGLYSAVGSIENGGREPSYPAGSQPGAVGAFYDDSISAQNGRPTITVTVDPHSVTFDAQGGTVNGQASQKVENLYKVPGLEGYVPVRDGGYVFDGWYKDTQLTQPAVAGEGLNGDITLYAKWKEPLTVSGTVTIAGSYQHDGEKVSVPAGHRATEALVILQQINGNTIYDIATYKVSFGGTYGDVGSAEYSFTGIPDDGKEYQISVVVLNYTSTYDNESDAGAVFTADKNKAVFGTDTVADVDANLTFVPDTYDQNVRVDASQLGESFRPSDVLVQITDRDYRGTGEYVVISQHTVGDMGLLIGLNSAGQGSGSEAVWKWHYNGTLYEYQAKAFKLYGNVGGIFTQAGVAYDADTAPYYIVYGAAAHWDDTAKAPSGDLVVTLVPRPYSVSFDLNVPAGETVTGMDAFAIPGGYGLTHRWSFDTPITAVPQRTGYVFKGWQAQQTGAYANGKIGADVHENVTLVAQWEARSDLALTVSHVDFYTGKVLETEVLNNCTFGQSYTADSLKNTYAGYQYHSASAQSVTIGTGDNAIIIYYAKPAYDYTVRYLHKTTNAVLKAEKSGSAAFHASVTEAAPAITGYVVVGDSSQTFTIDADNKVITFYYTERTDLTVTVRYKELGTNLTLHEDRTISNVRFGATVSLQPEKVNIAGFTYHSCDAVNNSEETFVVTAEQTTITLYYERNSYNYTVEYYYDGVLDAAGTIHDTAAYESVVAKPFAFEVTKGGKTYIFDYVENNPVTIQINEALNVIRVYYLEDADGNDVPDAYQATVTYKIVNGTWNGVADNDDPITVTFLMREFDPATNKWVQLHPTLGTTIPTGMHGNTGYTENLGAWDESIDASTPVVDKNEYTYAYTQLDEHIITAVVTGGKVTVKLNGSNVDADKVANYSKIFQHSTTEYVTMEFAPNSGYTLEYVTVDGRFYTAQQIMDGSFGASLKLFREQDHAVIVHYAMDANGDNIPDKYQKLVTYKVVNGTWNGTDTLDKTEWVTLYDASGNWSESGNGTLTSVPTGMQPVIGYMAAPASWNVSGVANGYTVQGTAAETFLYTFAEKVKITISVEVVNGTCFPAASVEQFHYDANRSTTITFSPKAGYMLESVTINGITYTSAADMALHLPNGQYTHGYTEDLSIKVVYTKDSVGDPTDPDNKGDGIPDKYQKRIVLRVVNGTWDGTDAADKVFYVTLMNGNAFAEDGSGTFTVPTGMKANAGYKGGAWDAPAPTGTVTGTDEAVYTYRFTAKQYADFTYTVEHYKQMPDSTYVLAETETITIPHIELNLDGTAFETGAVDTVYAQLKNYGSHYYENGEHGDRKVSGTPVYGQQLVLKLHYALDSHTVSYDLNGGNGAVGVDYSTTYPTCGSSVTVKRVPTRVGYVFKGWLANGVTYSADTVVTVTEDMHFVAQWEKQTGLSYMIFYLEQGTGKILSTTVQKSNGTFEDVIKASDYVIDILGYTFMNADRQQLVLGMDVTQNYINLYYAQDVLSTDPEDTDGDGIADKYQVTVRYEVTPDGKGTVVLKQEVITIYGENNVLLNAGKVTISGTKADPITGWRFYHWTDAAGAVISAQRTLAPMELEVEGGKTYTFTATLVPEASVIDPQAAAYKVEHYKWNAVSGAYELADTEMFADKLGATVTATAKTYAGFMLNEQAAGHKASGVVTMPALSGTAISNLLVLKLYYDADVIGPDNIPDRYQKKITFRVVNGTWGNTRTAGNSADIVTYVTLVDPQGKWSETGTAQLTAPTGMQPHVGYEGGAWDVVPPATVSGTEDAVYTYTFTKLPQTNPSTADTAALELLLVLMLLSAAGFVSAQLLSKKRFMN